MLKEMTFNVCGSSRFKFAMEGDRFEISLIKHGFFSPILILHGLCRDGVITDIHGNDCAIFIPENERLQALMRISYLFDEFIGLKAETEEREEEDEDFVNHGVWQ